MGRAVGASVGAVVEMIFEQGTGIAPGEHELGFAENAVAYAESDLMNRAMTRAADAAIADILSGKIVIDDPFDLGGGRPGADQRPVPALPGGKQPVQIDRHMRTVEIAHPHMQDTGRQCRPVIARPLHPVRQIGECSFRKR